MQLDLGNIKTINVDTARPGLQESEKSKRQRRLACASSTNDANPFSTVHIERDAFQNWGQIRGISHNEVINFDSAFGGPSCRWALAIQRLGG